MRLIAWLASFYASTSASGALTSLGGLPSTGGQLGGDLDANSHKVTNLATPAASGDATNKSYVDALLTGLDFKQSVRVASTANIDLSAPGTTIDGVTMASGNRFLAKDQTTGSQNGVYVWNGASSAATRATDCDVNAEVTAGLTVFVSEGSTNASELYCLTTADSIVVDTTALVFTQIGSLQLTSSAPANLSGSAAVGSSSTAARADHVHSSSGLALLAGATFTGQAKTAGTAITKASAGSSGSTAATTDYELVSANAADVARALPAATGTGRVITYKRVDSSNSNVHTFTITPNGSDTIEGDDGVDANSALTVPDRGARKLVDAGTGKWFQLP